MQRKTFRLRRAHWTGRRGQRGQAMVLFALMATVLIGMAGLVTDGSNLQENRRQLQNAADAAAFAGAYDLPSSSGTQAQTDSVQWLTKNGSGSTEVVTNQVSKSSGSSIYDTITVKVQRTVALKLMPVLHISKGTVNATAVVQTMAVTGVNITEMPFYFPYAVWAWDSKGNTHNVGDTVIFRSNAWVNDNVKNPKSNANWPKTNTNFKGFMSDQGVTVVSIFDTLSQGGSQCGQEPIAQLQAAYNAGQHIVLPIIDLGATGSSSMQLRIAGFVELNINIPNSNIPLGCPNDFSGQIVQATSLSQGLIHGGTNTPPSYAACGTSIGICTPVLVK